MVLAVSASIPGALPAPAATAVGAVDTGPASAGLGGTLPTSEEVAGEIIVRLAEGATAEDREAVAARVGGDAGRLIDESTFVVEVRPGAEDRALDQLADDTDVASVEPNQLVHALDVVPNDPCATGCGYGTQTELQTIGAPTAWGVSQGSSSVRIAVIDTGVDPNHEDLAGKVVASTNLVNPQFECVPASGAEESYHGTAVASIAAANTNNAKGMAGVGWGASIVSARVLNDCGNGDLVALTQGISWAVSQGARVVNLSLGGCTDSPTINAAISQARGAGAVVVAAAGNGGCSAGSSSGTSQPTYPAAAAGVISVGATNGTSTARASFSNYGSWVDLGAPGVSILAALRGSGSGYTRPSGTSFSAPMVAGTVALILAAHPSDNPDTVEARLARSARRTAQTGSDYAWGMLDAGTALTQAPEGYWLVASDGGIFAFGDAGFYGSTGSIRLNQPIVGMARTPSGQGYWLVASDGGIFAYGDAAFYGSTGSIRLNQPVVGMASTPSGRGYWLVASDGGIFAYGDAPFYGSTGSITLNQPITGMAVTASGGGYWMVGADGGIFAFGDGAFAGSNPSVSSSAVGIDGAVGSNFGYRITRSNGAVETYGSAGFYGQLSSAPSAPVVDIEPTVRGQGYWLTSSTGAVYTFGDGYYYGSMAGTALNLPVVGMARR